MIGVSEKSRARITGTAVMQKAGYKLWTRNNFRDLSRSNNRVSVLKNQQASAAVSQNLPFKEIVEPRAFASVAKVRLRRGAIRLPL